MDTLDFDSALLLVTTALACYSIGVIWTMELDVFRSWRLLKDKAELDRVRGEHWRKLPYFVFAPIAIVLICNIILLWQHPENTPMVLIWVALAFHLLADVLSGFMWGLWQAKLTFENHGPDSPLLARLINTHWIRILLVTLNGLALLAAAIISFS